MGYFIMRVITGEARGRKLMTLEGVDVRPTTDRVKEAIFSIIQFEIEGRKILDLFAGSGQLGIEALSRGARSATFIDKNKDSVAVVNENLKSTGLDKNALVKNVDSVSFLKTSRDFYDIVFLDPPYGSGVIGEALPLLSDRISQGGVVVCETSAREELPLEIGRFSIYREYKYGKIKITVYREKEVSE